MPPYRTAPGFALANNAPISVSNSVADTQLLQWQLPANTLQASLANFLGQAFIFDLVGNTDNVVTAAPVFSVFLKFVPTGTTFAAGTKVATISWTMATGAQTNKPWWARFIVTTRSLGSTGTAVFQGYGYSSGAAFAAGAFGASWGATPGAGTTINTTILNSLYLGMGWGTANASNVARCDQAMGTVFGGAVAGV